MEFCIRLLRTQTERKPRRNNCFSCHPCHLSFPTVCNANWSGFFFFFSFQRAFGSCPCHLVEMKAFLCSLGWLLVACWREWLFDWHLLGRIMDVPKYWVYKSRGPISPFSVEHRKSVPWEFLDLLTSTQQESGRTDRRKPCSPSAQTDVLFNLHRQGESF